MRVRKQVYELTAADFTAHPVWEFALDEEGEEGQDEATVRPFEPEGPVDPGDGMYVVAAVFTMADGSSAHGYLTPQPAGMQKPGYIQPGVLTSAGQVIFWRGLAKPSESERASAYARLNLPPASVFPVQFSSAVPLASGTVEGTLPGFGYYESLGAEPSFVR